MWEVQIQRSKCRKLLTNSQHPHYFLAEVIPRFFYIKFYHQANICGKYANGFSNFMIDDKDGQIPSPLSMFTFTTLHNALLEWKKNEVVHLKASRSNVEAERPDRRDYFNYMNDGVMNATCCTATVRKLLTSPGVANIYAFLMKTWNTLPESYQLRVYNNTLATVRRQIQQEENPTTAVVISVEAAHNHNDILLDYLTSKVALEEPEIRSTDPTIPIDNNCTDDKLHFVMPGSCGDYEDECDENDERTAIPTASQ